MKSRYITEMIDMVQGPGRALEGNVIQGRPNLSSSQYAIGDCCRRQRSYGAQTFLSERKHANVS